MLLADVFYIFIVVLINFLAGFILLSQLSLRVTSTLEKVFLSQLLGIIITITAYALYKTAFNSVFILVPVLLLSLGRFTKKYPAINNLTVVKTIALQVFVGLLIGVIAYYFFYLFMDKAIFGDNQFYASIAYALNQTGVETTNFDWTMAEKPVTLYHYSEVWFTALWSNVFNVNTLRTYYLLYIPVFGSTVFLGAFCLAKLLLNSKKHSTGISLLLAFVFLLIQNIDFPFYKITQNYYHIGSWFHNLKYSIVYIQFLVFVLLLFNRNYFVAFISLLLLVPLYSPIAPAILSGVFVATVYLFFKKLINKSDFIKLVAILFLVPLIYVLFYYFQPIKSVSTPLPELDFVSVLFKTFKVFFKLIVIGILPTLLVFIVVLWIRKTSLKQLHSSFNNQYLYSIVVGSIASIVVLFLFITLYFYVNHDAFQLLGNFVTPLFAVVFFVALIVVLKQLPQKIILPAISFILIYFFVLLWQNPSVSFNMVKASYFEPKCDHIYLSNIESEVNKIPKANFAYFRNYKDKHPMELKPFLFVPDNRIIHFKNDYVPISMSVLNMPENADFRYGNKSDFAFYNYYMSNQQNLLDSIYLNFVRDKNIRFVIVEKDAVLPAIFDNYIQYSSENKINGNTFYTIIQ